ncbi:MAG: hypothetical protein WCO63_03380 [Bacteroidota bacterium]
MKTIILLTAILSISLGLSAAKNNPPNYVTANGQTYFGEKIKMGISYTRIINSGEDAIKIENASVDSYMRDGHLFERLPMVCEENAQDKVFMEYLTTRGGLRLYKYAHYDENCNLSDGNFTKATAKNCFFVYKDGKFYLKIDEKNAQSCLPFFGINVR